MRSLAAVAMVLAVLGSSVPASGGEVASALVRATDLLDRLERGDAGPEREVVRELADLGPEALPAIFLSYQRLCSGPRHEECHRVLLDVLRALPGEDVRSFLAEMAGGPARLPDRLTSLEILGELRAAGASEAALSILLECPARQLSSPSASSALATALVRVLDRDPRGFDRLARMSEDAPPAVFRVLVLAAERSERGAALRFLVRSLARPSEIDREVLLTASRRPVLGPESFSTVELGAVRRSLRSVDLDRRAAAALLLGRLHDRESAEELVRLVESDDRSVKQAATSALRRISGLAIGADPSLWKRWLTEEQSWHEHAAETELERLDTLRGERLVNGILALGRRRLFRDRVVPAVLEKLDHPSLEVRRAACETLGRLGAPESLPGLVRRSEVDVDPSVLVVASAAVSAVTGRRDLGAGSWREVLDIL